VNIENRFGIYLQIPPRKVPPKIVPLPPPSDVPFTAPPTMKNSVIEELQKE
jgi:hypothetical protein